MADQLLGKAYIRVDGTLYDTLSGASISNITGITRDAVVGSRVLGFTEKVAVPTIDCDMPHNPTTSVLALGSVTDATITFECDNGTVYVLNDAWCSNPGKPTADGGKLAGVQFMAITADEQLGG
ncbi:MAG TPA: phage tail tube protein [Aliidongia sp.]|uniref:phage tail tube protein n=1 Tax=Aliidongia sp. TaxID=1914230 RepID=UPI002DDD6BCD|nr:phage tail tube protein [Aliidongia sp.]HEV2675277.1 phage tail tube protein [Aliidongia sp.]